MAAYEGGHRSLPYHEKKFYPKSGIIRNETNNENAEEWRDDDEEEGEEEKEEEIIQSLSFSEINELGTSKFLQMKTLRQQKGILIDTNTRKTCMVKAKLHVRGSWWIVDILRTRKEDEYITPSDTNALSYKLITDQQLVNQYNLVQMFLSDSHNTEAMTKFEMFVQSENEELKLSYEYLTNIIDRFKDHLPEQDKNLAYMLKSKLQRFEGLMIKRAEAFPELFRYLPQLLPYQFLAIMCSDIEDDNILLELDRALREEPWVLAFKRILFKEYKLMGTEVTKDALRNAGILCEIPESPYRDAIEIYDHMKEKTREDGHTCLKSSALESFLFETLENTQNSQRYRAAIEYMLDKEILVKERINGKSWLFIYDLWNCELTIANGLKFLFDQHNEDNILNVDLDTNPNFANIRTDRDQMRAARFILNYPVVVVSGKGGCGKTTVVTKVLSESLSYSRERPIVLFTAPTGKAAKLLGRKADTDGYTLHQIIWSFRAFKKKQRKEMGPEQNEENSKEKATDVEGSWKFSCVECLVVDECSMVSVQDFSTLFEILLENAKLKRVIFLGDVRQLPSVLPGNFLEDIFTTLFQKPGCSIELKTNHRAESDLIVRNATKISSRVMPGFDAERNYKLHKIHSIIDDRNKERDNPEHFHTVFTEILGSQENLKDHTTSHIIAFERSMCRLINSLAINIYNPDPSPKPRRISDFRVGDKVGLFKNGWVRLFKKNQTSGSILPVFADEDDEENVQPTQVPDIGDVSFMSERRLQNQGESNTHHCDNDGHAGTQGKKSEKPDKEQKMLRLCNGEIYFIKDDHEIRETNARGRLVRRRYLKLSDEDPDSPTEFYVLYSEMMRECKMAHAWAKTIHTFQGSECDTVVFVVGNNGMQNWQHVYTALTRGRKAIHVVGRENGLARAVSNRKRIRYTGLAYHLRRIIHTSYGNKLANIAQTAGSAKKPVVSEKLVNGSGDEEKQQMFDKSDMSGAYMSGMLTPTNSIQSGITPSSTYQNTANNIRNLSLTPISSETHKFIGEGLGKNGQFSGNHDLTLQSPAKTRLFKEQDPGMSTPAGCRCFDIRSCVCGITPISHSSLSIEHNENESSHQDLVPVDGTETESFGSQWSDVNDSQDLFKAEDDLVDSMIMQQNGQKLILDESESDDFEFFEETEKEPFTIIKPNTSSNRASSLPVDYNAPGHRIGPSPKRPAEEELIHTPTKQVCSRQSHTSITPAFKKLDFSSW